MHGGDLDPFWIAANPASEMLPKRAPTIKPQKQAYLGKTGGGQGIWMQYVSVSLKMATVPLIYMRHQYIGIMSTSSLKFIASVCTTVPRTSLFLVIKKLLDAVGESVSLQMIPKKMRDFSNSHNDNSRIFGLSQVTRLRESTKSPRARKTMPCILQDEGVRSLQHSESLETQVPCFTHEIILLGVDMDKEPFVHEEGQGKV